MRPSDTMKWSIGLIWTQYTVLTALSPDQHIDRGTAYLPPVRLTTVSIIFFMRSSEMVWTSTLSLVLTAYTCLHSFRGTAFLLPVLILVGI